MIRPSSVLLIALVSAVSGLLFLANTVVGSDWLINSILSPPSDSQGLLPIANAIGKDLMLDVAPQLHPSTLVGESARQIKFQHWIDNDIHCEDCLRLEIPNNGKKAGAAFSSNGAVYNFEGAKKIRFYVMGEETGAKVNFKAVGNDKVNNGGGGGRNNSSSNNNDLFTNQDFVLTSQNVTLNQTWGYFEMNVEGEQQRLSNVKYPFGLEVAQGKGNAVTVVYLKGITYSSEPVQEEYLLAPSSANTTSTSLPMTSAQATATTSLNITLQDNATESANAPATVEFNATAIDGQEPYSFDWDFKDGNATETDTDGNIAHTFVTPGLYNVTVNVRDSVNNTGSAATLVDVVEDETVADQPATGSEDNSTQDLQQPTTGASNNTNNNITSPLGDIGDNETDEEGEVEVQEEPLNQTGVGDVNTSEDGSINEGEANDTSANTGTGTSTGSDITVSNSPPVANAGRDIVGVPNDQVILDAIKSSDPDVGDAIVSYLWEQESGPTAEINDQASSTPIVTLPNVDEDSTIVFSLTVNDGSADSEEEDNVSIFVDHVEPLTSNNNIQQRVLKPSDITTSQWTPSGGCEGDIQCLADGSHATVVAAGTENTDNVNLYSFGEFSAGGTVVDPNSLVIERVVAEIYAKKLGNTEYVSFAIDDPTEGELYSTPSISIGSNSFQKYSQVWDINPVTGEEWTYDSLNSLVLGFKYDGGQSGVEISELQLEVSYYLPVTEAAAPTMEADPVPSNEPDTGEQVNGDGAAAPQEEEEEEEPNDENGTSDTEDTAEEEPTIEPDSTNTGGVDSNDDEGGASSDGSEE
jgi:hypothetical protein